MQTITYAISASFASFASGRADILMTVPPQDLYMLLSARVLNCGPSNHLPSAVRTRPFHPTVSGGTIPIQINNPSLCIFTPSPFNTPPLPMSNTALASPVSKGSAKLTCPTNPPSKKVLALIPFVRSMICEGMTKSRGRMYSCKLPTAENAMMERTPMDRRAAMLARLGTSVGVSS